MKSQVVNPQHLNGVKYVEAPTNYLQHPVLLNEDGSSRKIHQHKAQGLAVQGVKDLLGGPPVFVPLVEIDDVFHGIVYVAAFKRDIGPNVLATMVAGNQVMGKALIVNATHIDLQALGAESDNNVEALQKLAAEMEAANAEHAGEEVGDGGSPEAT